MSKKNSKKELLYYSGFGTAAISGGGFGTLVVGIAQLLPTNCNWKTLLITIAPAISVAISSLWFWVKNNISKARKEKIVAETLEKTRNYLVELLTKPGVSDERRKQAERQLILLEEKNFQRAIQVIKEKK